MDDGRFAVAERDRALARELAIGTVRWWLALRPQIEELLERPTKKRDRDVLALMVVGLYQLRHTRIPAHAAVAETVAAVRGLNKPWAAGMVNAVLRRSQREVGAARQVHDAHPAWLREQLHQAWPGQAREIMAANNTRPPMTLRVNRRVQDPGAYRARLRAAGMQARAVPGVADALVLAQPVAVEALPGFARGAVSVQDAGAQLAADVLDLAPGQRLLDACAAPGGKLCHALEREPALAGALAVDPDAQRQQRTGDNLARLGLHARLAVADARTPARWWDGRPFHRILVDAPCSGSGVIRRHPDIKLLRRAADIAAFRVRQEELLGALWPLLARGGKLVYASCSVLPAENDEPIETFCMRHADARACVPALPFAVACRFGRQVLPGPAGLDGFYYACLYKD